MTFFNDTSLSLEACPNLEPGELPYFLPICANAKRQTLYGFRHFGGFAITLPECELNLIVR